MDAATSRQQLLVVTGRLAEPLVRRVVSDISAADTFDVEVCVLGISVAALMHTDWVARKLSLARRVDRVILPGHCQGDLPRLSQQFGVEFVRGPKDIRDLPAFLGAAGQLPADLSRFDIEIIAEINHAPRLGDAEMVRIATALRDAGADVIDLGMVPGESCRRTGEMARRLAGEGLRVSIDSFDRPEVEAAVAAGAELILSCNSQNVDWVAQLGAEVVVIPDDARDLSSIAPLMARIEAHGGRYRIDPVLEPIGYGFASSLSRYFEARRRWPAVPMLMGVGNLTELTDVDSAGINLLLTAICQELEIRSVLTTQVINWARTSVAELDHARRLMHHAVTTQTLPKHVDPSLIMLRDPRLPEYGGAALEELAAQLADASFRIFVERGEIHLMNRDGYWRGSDPFELYDRMASETRPLETSHAFYLGYELAKAVTALTLGKQYQQDQSLQWGFLTVPESSPHARRHRAAHPE